MSKSIINFSLLLQYYLLEKPIPTELGCWFSESVSTIRSCWLQQKLLTVGLWIKKQINTITAVLWDSVGSKWQQEGLLTGKIIYLKVNFEKQHQTFFSITIIQYLNNYIFKHVFLKNHSHIPSVSLSLAWKRPCSCELPFFYEVLVKIFIWKASASYHARMCLEQQITKSLFP